MKPAWLVRWLTPAPDSGVAEDIRRGKSPWADSIHLLWSAWVFTTPLFDGGLKGYTRIWWLCTLLSYPLFLLLFARIQLAPRRQTHYYPWAMALLCFVLLPWYPSGLSYFVYACVLVCHCRARWRVQWAQLVTLNVIFVLLSWRAGYPVVLQVSVVVSVVVISVIVAVERIYQDKDAALRLSQDEVRRLATQAERERIGRDLHDLLGHTLSLVALKSELARKLAQADPARAQQEMAEVERVSRHALAEVRAAVTGMRRSDLAAELASARLMLEASDIVLEASLPESLALPAEVEAPLALVLREAVTNIHRHARATTALVAITREAEQWQMRIQDNGRGGLVAHGNGLHGMRERVQALGGTLAIDSPAQRGTTLTVALPLCARLREGIA